MDIRRLGREIIGFGVVEGVDNNLLDIGNYLPLIRYCGLRLKGRVGRQTCDACSRERKRRARLWNRSHSQRAFILSWHWNSSTFERIRLHLRGDGSGFRQEVGPIGFPMGHRIPDRLIR